MAILKSEETQCPTSLELTFVRERSGADAVQAAALAAQTGAGAVMPLAGTAQVKGADDQTWAYVAFNLVSGGNRLTTPEGADFVLCRRPADEVSKLTDLLDQFAAKKIERVLFEPSEPSFEISLERTSRGGIKVEAWLDAGNATTAIYTWDAAGIRFYTTDAHVVSFTRELRSEFQIASAP